MPISSRDEAQGECDRTAAKRQVEAAQGNEAMGSGQEHRGTRSANQQDIDPDRSCRSDFGGDEGPYDEGPH